MTTRATTLAGTTRRTRSGAALLLATGLVSTLGTGAAWGETIPSSPTDPIVTAMYQHDGGPSESDSWTPGDSTAPGVASVTSTAASNSSAASSADLAQGVLSASSSAQDNDTPVNRIDAGSAVADGFYLAEAAVVKLTWSMAGSTSAVSSGDGHSVTDIDAVVAIDCIPGEGGCVPDNPNDPDDQVIGHRNGDTASGNDAGSLSDSGSVHIPLTAGWHEVTASTSSSSRAVDTATSSGTVTLTFALEIPADGTGELTGWASASDLLPVTGGQEIEDDVPPPPPPAPTPAELLTALASDIQAAADAGAIANARPLLSKVQAAQAAEASGDEQAAAAALTALRNHLSAQSGQRIPADLAGDWSADAAAVFPSA